MSKRYLQWGYDSFKDTKTGEISDNHIHLLNQQAERIAELEEQLKNSVRPKFKVNDRIFVIVNNEVEEYYVDEVLLKVKGTLVAYRDICKETTITEKNEIFATKEEALAKLEELRGE